MAAYRKPEKAPPKLTKHGWEVRRILFTVVSFVLTVASVTGWAICRHYYKGINPEYPNEALRYPYQLVCIIMALCVVAFILSLRKLVPEHVKGIVWRFFKRIFMICIGNPLKKFAAFLRRIFGLPEYSDGGGDEHGFIFNLDGLNLFRKFQSVTNQLRWRDLQSNAEKIRFLFIKFVVKMIKSGYRHQSFITVEEMQANLRLTGDPARLFTVYTGARYSGGRYPVSDEDVEMAEKLVKKK